MGTYIHQSLLDAMVDAVLSHRPKDKQKKPRKRKKVKRAKSS